MYKALHPRNDALRDVLTVFQHDLNTTYTEFYCPNNYSKINPIASPTEKALAETACGSMNTSEKV